MTSSKGMLPVLTISVPVYCAERVVACLSCSWLPAVAGEHDITSRHLPDLLAAARAIGARLKQAKFES